MRMRKTIGLSLALLVVSAAAMAKEAQPGHHHLVPSSKAKPAKTATAAGKTSGKRHRASGKVALRSNEAQPGRHHPVSSIKSKRVRTAAADKTSGKRRRTIRRVTARSKIRHNREAGQIAARLPPPDQYIGPLQVTGRREIGFAAWYGGRHLGRRTASGERLDAVHVTAAHRWLPLHSLVRVTNLSNGRSVIATINDRGPVATPC